MNLFRHDRTKEMLENSLIGFLRLRLNARRTKPCTVEEADLKQMTECIRWHLRKPEVDRLTSKSFVVIVLVGVFEVTTPKLQLSHGRVVLS